MNNPFCYFNSSPKVIRLAVMMYIRYPSSLRQVEDLLFERGTGVRACNIVDSIAQLWPNRLGNLGLAPLGWRETVTGGPLR